MNTLPQIIDSAKSGFLSVDSGLDFAREARFALQILEGNDYLAKMPPNSIKISVTNVALTGLTLNPVLGLAYLVPRKGKCTLDISYKGLVKILTDSGAVKNIIAELVYEGDEFSITKGTRLEIIHRPAFKNEVLLGCYAVGFFPSGGYQFEFMTVQELNRIKQRSESVKAGKSSPWETDEGEMQRKTVVRRLYKLLPKSAVSERVAKALELEHEAADIKHETPKAESIYTDFVEVEDNSQAAKAERNEQ